MTQIIVERISIWYHRWWDQAETRSRGLMAGLIPTEADPGSSSVGKPLFEAKKLQRGEAEVKTIHKYSLDATHEDKVTVMMPRVAKIVMVGSQNGQPFLWALVDSDSPLFERHYRLIATGQPIPGGYNHVASFTRNNGESTWHLFE